MDSLITVKYFLKYWVLLKSTKYLKNQKLIRLVQKFTKGRKFIVNACFYRVKLIGYDINQFLS